MNENRECIEEWEHEFWPHRLPYRELSIATNVFKEEQLLGSGSFGTVYKGILPSNNLEIAVKCIIKDSAEGMKEFIAKISSVGHLQHKNLVQLRGHCSRNAISSRVMGVVHRDVKSSNILIDSELNAKLGDFGLAHLYDHNQNSQMTQVVFLLQPHSHRLWLWLATTVYCYILGAPFHIQHRDHEMLGARFCMIDDFNISSMNSVPHVPRITCNIPP
eukprot:Gb_38133 [translate_table: standard]